MRKSAGRICRHAAMVACAGLYVGVARAQDVQNLPPLNGFQPLVIFSLSDEQYPSDFTIASFSAHTSSGPGTNGVPSNTLPVGQTPKYFVAVLDTGAQSSIITLDTANQADLAGANRLGDQEQQIVGASGSEFADVSDALGVYMSGFNNATVSSGTLGVAPGAPLAGMWNTSVLITQPGSALPNIVGSPTVALYQTSIKNSQPQHVTIGGTTYRSPTVGFAPRNSAVSSSYGTIALTTTNTVGGDPAFEPSVENINNTGDNPAVPTIWESMFASVKVSHTDGSETASFLFDTGAQVSVLSHQTAADIGIFTAGDNPTPPDFFTEVTGVGGSVQEIPGYYINGVSLTTTAGKINFSRVPVIVLDLPDPRSSNDILPGVLGTNLFGARDLVINAGTGATYLGISPEWSWKGTAGGTWGDSTKWGLVLPNGIDTQANFFTPAGATLPQTITVDAGGFTVGSLAFDNANRYTLNGPGTITLDVSVDHAQINVNSGSHTINAPMTLRDDTDVNVVQSTSTLTITSDVAAGSVGLFKQGAGVLEMKNVRASALHVDGGTLKVLSNGTLAGASRVTSLSITNGAKLDMTNNALAIDYAPGASPATVLRSYLQSGYASGSWTGAGIVSSNAAAIAADPSNLHKTAIGFAEASTVGNPSTWFGQSIDGTSLVTRYVFAGDANLDGSVNSTDFVSLSQNFGGTADLWRQGDFNYDGVVNALDFNMLASNWGQVMSDQALGQLVPEPVAMGVLAMSTLALGRRRCMPHLRRLR